jgi:uncharacterized protein YgiB involved in biofilm formation
MNKLILALFAAAAMIMTYIGLQPECADGKVFADEAACQASFDAGFCRTAFARAHQKASIDYAPFSTQDDCLRQFPFCMPHGVVNGFVPKPRGTCVVRGENGQMLKSSPIYERIGASIQR